MEILTKNTKLRTLETVNVEIAKFNLWPTKLLPCFPQQNFQINNNQLELPSNRASISYCEQKKKQAKVAWGVKTKRSYFRWSDKKAVGERG